MGRQEILEILKENKDWMTNKDIQIHLNQSTNSIGRITSSLAHDFPMVIKKKAVKTGHNKIFYYKHRR